MLDLEILARAVHGIAVSNIGERIYDLPNVQSRLLVPISTPISTTPETLGVSIKVEKIPKNTYKRSIMSWEANSEGQLLGHALCLIFCVKGHTS